jgi:hypothetical protein
MRLNTDLVQHGGSPARAAADPGYRQLREPSPRRARAVGLQRPLRVCLLPSPLRLQPPRRLLDRHAPARQRPQCRRVGEDPPPCH